jgi:hypothetical protein
MTGLVFVFIASACSVRAELHLEVLPELSLTAYKQHAVCRRWRWAPAVWPQMLCAAC